MTIIILIGFIFVGVSIALIWLGGSVLGDIGKSLLTGSIVACAVLALQVELDSQRRDEEKRDQFRFSVSFAENLSGIQPQYSLSGMFLRGKIFNNADLEGQDLSNADLQNVSLQNTNLNHANLDSANLVGADLTGGEIIGTDLANADLRAARLKFVTLELPPDPSDLQGTQVNARTCWPEDFLANIHFPPEERLRHALKREATRDHGKTIVDADNEMSWGRACVLSDENIWDDLGLYASNHDLSVIRPKQMRQSVGRLAITFGRSVENITRRFEGGRPMKEFGDAAPALPSRICANTMQISAQGGELTGQGFGVIIVQRPGQVQASAMVIRQPDRMAGRAYTVQFRDPLRKGTKIGLVDEVPRGERNRLTMFGQWRRVSAC